MTRDKEQNQLLDAARQAGWRVQDGKHIKLFPPLPHPMIVVAKTPSDWRAFRNNRAACRRAGLNV